MKIAVIEILQLALLFADPRACVCRGCPLALSAGESTPVHSKQSAGGR